VIESGLEYLDDATDSIPDGPQPSSKEAVANLTGVWLELDLRGFDLWL